MNLDDAKAMLPLSVLWSSFGLPGVAPERDGQLVSCPFPAGHKNGDRKPSFNFYGGGRRFKCFACGVDGGAVDLAALALGLNEKAACQKVIELAGGRGAALPTGRVAAVPAKDERPKVELPTLRRCGPETWLRAAESRAVSCESVRLAVGFDVLRFGEVCGFPSWVLTDRARRAAEARRLDRLPFPAVGKLGERKAHSLKGTDKSWPVGAGVLGRARVVESRVAGKQVQRVELPPPSFRAIMLVEGGPDFLAALHFLHAFEVGDVWPVAMLGRSTGGAIHPDALELLRGRRVRVYPHADSDGGGVEAAWKWGRQLVAAGCAVDGFSFEGLRQYGGSPVKDLNDCCLIHPDDAAKLGELLP